MHRFFIIVLGLLAGVNGFAQKIHIDADESNTIKRYSVGVQIGYPVITGKQNLENAFIDQAYNSEMPCIFFLRGYH